MGISPFLPNLFVGDNFCCCCVAAFIANPLTFSIEGCLSQRRIEAESHETKTAEVEDERQERGEQLHPHVGPRLHHCLQARQLRTREKKKKRLKIKIKFQACDSQMNKGICLLVPIGQLSHYVERGKAEGEVEPRIGIHREDRFIVDSKSIPR